MLFGHFCLSINLTVHPRSLARWLMDVGRCILCFRVNAFLEVRPFPKGRGEAAVGKGHLRPYLHQSLPATAIRTNFYPQNNGTPFEQLERRQSYQPQTKDRDSSIILGAGIRLAISGSMLQWRSGAQPQPKRCI